VAGLGFAVIARDDLTRPPVSRARMASGGQE
jgi:hypothetical protein